MLMPQASDELRQKMFQRFGDPVDDGGPIEFLRRAGYPLHQGGFWGPKPGITSWAEMTVDEQDCVNFLIEEWDYDGVRFPGHSTEELVIMADYSAQPGSPEFDGAEAYEAHLASEELKRRRIIAIDKELGELEAANAAAPGWGAAVGARGERIKGLRSERDSLERYVSPVKPPEGLDRELLDVLVEECGEVITECAAIIKRATKALRFGLEEKQPGQELTNAQRLAREIGDLNETVRRLVVRRVLDRAEIEEGQFAKSQQLDKYLQNQVPR